MLVGRKTFALNALAHLRLTSLEFTKRHAAPPSVEHVAQDTPMFQWLDNVVETVYQRYAIMMEDNTLLDRPGLRVSVHIPYVRT